MNLRGWIEHEQPAEGEKFTSKGFHFMYATKTKDCFRVPERASFQHLNHFEGTKALTTKVGLTHNMKDLVWHYNMDIDEFFPTSYDLSELESDEMKDFKEDFKFCQVIAFLKLVQTWSTQTIAKNIDRIIIALSICEKRSKLLTNEMF